MISIKIQNEWIIDTEGRKVLLRGVNLGGDSKVPINPNGATHIKTDFTDHRDVSFVERPFPLKEADEHFKRIEHWGFNCLRFIITWEAIEHKGPKTYDLEYLEYIEELIKIAESYNLYIFIDPHQDVWSRMSGGDGAPGWTFEKVGLDSTKFDVSDAALVMQYRYDSKNPTAYPHMHWHSNINRFASSTMFTLFFGGLHFAPSCTIEGINVQEYLQNHYIAAIKQVATRLKDFPKVIGYDTLNEPDQGWIEKYVDGSGIGGLTGDLGYSFTPFDAMLTGSGYTRRVKYREIKGYRIKEIRNDDLNKEKVSCWLNENRNIWKNEGIWDLGDDEEPILLKNDFFVYINEKKVDFHYDYLSPFIQKFTKEIRDISQNAIIFFEGIALKTMLGEDIICDTPKNTIHAAHWYDMGTWGTKRSMIKINYNIQTNKPVFGSNNVQKVFIQQLDSIKNISKKINEGIPTLIGEFGLGFDLNKKKAYKTFKKNPEKAWKKHIKLLDMYYNAMDASLLNSTQWVYSAANCNEWGDLWNLEDYSLFSRDQQLVPNDINSGGRAIEGFCRPHYIQCAGTPTKMEFNLKTGRFYFEFDGDISIKAPTILYIPEIQYQNGYQLKISEGEVLRNENDQLVFININKEGMHTIEILRS